MENLNQLIGQYGYAGIFVLLVLGIVGLPVPDETLLTLTGYLVYKGSLSFIPAFASSLLGSTVGITISYIIGRTFGNYILHKYGRYINLTDEKLEKAHNWFERIGRWSLLIGYFIPGIRHIFTVVAGASKLKTWEFVLFAYSGAFIWVIVFFSIGYFFGDKWAVFLQSIHRNLLLVSIIAVFLIATVYLLKKKLFGIVREK
ncbi:MAG: DedA family protein [Ignavibacteria bacterium]